ncbi:hypothetical protein SAMN06298212_10643 [Ruaniaceae bacterium KH17]|nr:hypothetical protein SAMN06298212_10643 [Ruaniaceae bacterium KH17]
MDRPIDALLKILPLITDTTAWPGSADRWTTPSGSIHNAREPVDNIAKTSSGTLVVSACRA